MVGMDTFIFGKSLIGFDEAALCCFGAFSVGAGEVVRGRLVDWVAVATPLPRSVEGSWTSFDLLSERGGTTSSSSSSSSSTSSSSLTSSSSSSSSSATSESHSSSSWLSPPLASPSSVEACAPLGIEYSSVRAW